MSKISTTVHMIDDLTTAEASLLDVVRVGDGKRIVAFVSIGELTLAFSSLAQIEEVQAVLEEAHSRFRKVQAEEIAEYGVQK